MTRPLTLVVFLVLLVAPTRAQDFPAHLTEVWQPEPPVVMPGDGTSPPSDAIVLFDGTSLDAWESETGDAPAGWTLADGVMTIVPSTEGGAGIRTKQSFGDVQLHLEWRTPSPAVGEGQDRGNSGVFLQERYEVQVLDSYGNRTYSNGQAASIYKQHIPMVNASRPPGAWQTYDIFFRAPVFRDNGELVRKATVTVVHNGVLVQLDAEIQGGTTYTGLPKYEPHGDAPLTLQEHDHPVSYRNIWMRRL